MEHNQNTLRPLAECGSATYDADYCCRLTDEGFALVEARGAQHAAEDIAERARFFSGGK